MRRVFDRNIPQIEVRFSVAIRHTPTILAGMCGLVTVRSFAFYHPLHLVNSMIVQRGYAPGQVSHLRTKGGNTPPRTGGRNDFGENDNYTRAVSA